MDFSPLTMIKYGEDKGDFPLSTSNKVKIPSWTSFAASFQVFLTTCTNILGIGRRELSTENGFECMSSWWTESLSAETTRFEDKNKDKGWAKKLLCSH